MSSALQKAFIWSMLKKQGIIIQYWKPEQRTAMKSPWRSAVTRMPPMADMRRRSTRPRRSELKPPKVKLCDWTKKEMVTPVKTSM